MQLRVAEIKLWMAKNMLKLNDDKTEILFISSPFYCKNVQVETIQVGNTEIVPASSARNIGVIFDESLSMKYHITSICKAAHYHLRKIGAIRKYLTQESCTQLVHAFITSKLDYGNALLNGLPENQISRLQRVMNTAARIVSLKSKYDHIQPILKFLHWLPVQQRIKFKVLLLTFHAIHGDAPSYLTDMIHIYTPARSLRSRDKFLLVEHKTNQSYGSRAFSVSGPRMWNSLPEPLRKLECLDTFKQHLKTFLFKEAYCDN